MTQNSEAKLKADAAKTAGDWSVAAAGYQEALRSDPGDSGALLGLAVSLARAGRPDAAGDAYQTLLRRNPDHRAAIAGLADLHQARGDWEGALEYYLRLPEVGEQLPQKLIKMASCFEQMQHRFEFDRVESQLLELSHEHRQAALWCMSRLTQTRRADAAYAIGKHWIERNSEDEDVLSEIVGALNVTARKDEAEIYKSRLNALREKAPGPKTFGELLATAPTELILNRCTRLPIQVAWSHANQDMMEYSEWKRRALRGTELWNWYARWICRNPAALDAIDHLIIPPDFSAIRDVLKGGSGCFVVGPHLGAPGTLSFLLKAHSNVRVLSSAKALGEAPGMRPLVLAATASGISTIRAIVDALKEGAVICAAPDTPAVRPRGNSLSGTVNGSIMGASVAIPSLVPKMARRQSVPTFWMQSLWRDGSINIDVARLPDPEPDEDQTLWTQRWAAAYLGRVEALLGESPENLNLRASIWNAVKPRTLD